MGIIVDVVIVALIGISAFLGYKKGLVGVAFKIISFIVALVLAFILCKPVGNLIIANTEFDESIHNTIQSSLESKNVIEKGNPTEEIDVNIENIENMPSVITEFVSEEIKELTTTAQNNVASAVADGLTENIIYAITFILIYVVARIILFFLKSLAEAIAELPILKQFNEAGGTAYGILRGAFLTYLILAVISLIGQIANLGDLLEFINSSYLGSFLYNNNILLKILF